MRLPNLWEYVRDVGLGGSGCYEYVAVCTLKPFGRRCMTMARAENRSASPYIRRGLSANQASRTGKGGTHPATRLLASNDFKYRHKYDQRKETNVNI